MALNVINQRLGSDGKIAQGRHAAAQLRDITGIHAAGVIIAPKDLTEIIPVATSKDTTLLITQYDGKVIEDARSYQ